MRKLILAGNAVTASILHDYLQADTRYEVLGITVDDEFAREEGIGGLPVAGISEVEQVFPPDSCAVVMAAGYNDLNRVRESLFKQLKDKGYAMETYVHPDAKVYTGRALGEGCVVLPNAVVEPHALVGSNAVIWSRVTVAHHSVVEEHCWIASGAVISGEATVRRNSFLGVNATLVNKVTVSEFNIVGAAALISKNTAPNTVHLARSAEPLRYSAEDYIRFFGI